MGEIIAVQAKGSESGNPAPTREKEKKGRGRVLWVCNPNTWGGGNKDKDQLGLMLASGAKPHHAPDLVREILSGGVRTRAKCS